MSNTRKSLMVAIATTLVLSTASFGMPAPTAAAKLKEQLPTLQLQKPATKIPARLVSPENPSEKVRIIVELEKAPAIDTATNKGVLYKELPESQRNSLESSIEKDQANIQASISKIAKNIQYKENFTTVFNGFSAEVDAKDVTRIALTPGVKAIHESTEYTRPEVEPNMVHSKELVQAQLAWEKFDFKGEGMVVGVIDTGIDPSHRDMVLTDDTSGDITSSEVDALLLDGLDGKYFSAKVPYGYNYMDGNQQILDLGPGASMHGMHVSGTVGANGDEENGGIKGVAPEAQLLALKVFGNDPLFPSTFGDIYVKAIDDSIKLGADVINMSLGSTAGYVDNSNPEQMAVARAQANGLLVAISAGNSDMFGSGTWYPYAENQDYGLTGSPSVSEDSFGVASFENSFITASSFTYEFDGAAAGRALFLLANDAEPNDLPLEEYPIEFAGFGTAADFEGKDLTGKFALVSRGQIAFVDKGLNAQAAGAEGVIVYNNAAGTISMASSSEIKIPYMSALKIDGETLKAALDAGQEVTVGFDGKYVETPSPSAGTMSSFTSWGPTPNLDFKPEITAPGGNIFSTLNNDGYGLMSGTSMAAPHVAGGTALVMERVDKDFGLTGAERVQFAKNLMMNTAKPVELTPGEFVSPRRQGAGIMQLANALETDVMVTNAATGEAKVALKEIAENQFSFSLNAKNFSDIEKTYNVNVQLQVDQPVNGGGMFVTLPNNAAYGSIVLDETDATITVPATVTVPANGEATIDIAVDASASATLKEYFTNGYFIDGFVTLVDPNEETSGNVPLAVPFFGFNGSWDDAPIFDYNTWEDLSYWGVQGLADEDGNYISGPSLGADFDPSKFAFSPNGDGTIDKVIPVYSLIRNAKEFEVNVLDADGKKLRTIRTASNLTKHYISNATRNPYTFNPAYGWDGKINGKAAVDGQYTLELRAVIDFPGAEFQSLKYPIIVDTVAPTADIAFDAATKEVTVAYAADNTGGVGIDRVEVYVNDIEVTEAATLQSYKISSLQSGDNVSVKVWDIAGNVLEKGFGEEQTPVIYLDSPDFFGYETTNQVLVSGTVEDDSKINSVKVNGVEADSFDGSKFSHTLTLDDGVQNVNVEATDEQGNTIDISRKVFVDTEKPTVVADTSGLTGPYESTDPNPTIPVTIGDNFDEITLFLDGNEIFTKPITEPYGMVRYTNTVDVELPLVNGQNDFELKVVDLVGHETIQIVSVTKKGIVINSPSNYELKSTSEVAVSGSVADAPDTVSVTVNGENAILEGTNYTHTLNFEDGVHSINVVATDGAGKTLEVSSQVVVDTTKPTLDTLSVPSEASVSNLPVKLNITDNFNEIRLYLDGKEVFFNQAARPYTATAFDQAVDVVLPLVEGVNTFELKVVDLVGHETTEVITVNKNDTVGPVVTLASPVEDYASEKLFKVTVSGTVADDANVTSLKVNGIAATTFNGTTFSHELTFTENGINNVEITAVDEYGNETTVTRNVVVDTVVPTIEATVPSTTSSATHTVKVKIGDNFDAYTLFSNDVKVFEKLITDKTDPTSYVISDYTQTVDVELTLEDGKNDFVLKVVDLAGNEVTKSLSITKQDVVVTPTPPPVINPPAPPVPPVVDPTPVTFGDISSHWAKKEIEALATKNIIFGKTAELFAPEAKLTRAEFAVLVSRALNLEAKAYEGTFTDVKEYKAWAYAGIEAAARAGIINGLGDGTFNPDAQITREEIATIVVRAVEYQDASLLKDLDTSKVFADDKKISAFAKVSVQQAVALGIVNGRNGNLFAPQDNATRAETAVMLYRALDKLGEL